MKISNGLKLYCKSMGKVFRVSYIAKTCEEANEFMRKNRNTGLIAEDSTSGLLFIAELYQMPVNSNVLPD